MTAVPTVLKLLDEFGAAGAAPATLFDRYVRGLDTDSAASAMHLELQLAERTGQIVRRRVTNKGPSYLQCRYFLAQHDPQAPQRQEEARKAAARAAEVQARREEKAFLRAPGLRPIPHPTSETLRRRFANMCAELGVDRRAALRHLSARTPLRTDALR